MLLIPPALRWVWWKKGNGKAAFWRCVPARSSHLKFSTNQGFRFGHALLGTSDYTVIQFIFEFYGFSQYNVLINPNNPLVQTVLTTMIESGDYFFFAINANQTATAFRSDMGQENLVGLKTNLPHIQNARTTDVQYREVLSIFERNPQPAGPLLKWVCRDHVEYLDLTENRLDLNPTS